VQVDFQVQSRQIIIITALANQQEDGFFYAGPGTTPRSPLLKEETTTPQQTLKADVALLLSSLGNILVILTSSYAR